MDPMDSPAGTAQSHWYHSTGGGVWRLGKSKKKHIPEAYFFDGSEIWLTTLDVLKYSQITGYFIISTGEFSAFLEPSTATRVSPEPIVINSRFDTGPLKKWPKINGCFRKWWYPQNTPK